MKSIILCFSIMMIFTGSALASDDNNAAAQLRAARSLKCIFITGASARWDNGSVNVGRLRDEMTYHFDGIDSREGKARLIANIGAADVFVTSNPLNLTFFEATPAGNMVMTTVFAMYQPGTRAFIAVTSRHMLLMTDTPMPSQYYGSCEVWG